MSDQDFLPALANEDSVREFSSRLLELAGVFQAVLHNLSETDRAFATAGYGVLMEVYGLRTRAYILMNDPGNHIANSLGFSQQEMLSILDKVSSVVPLANRVSVVGSMILFVATFTVSLGEDRAKVVDFLFKTLCDDVDECGWRCLANTGGFVVRW